MSHTKLLIVGMSGPCDIGSYLYQASQKMKVESQLQCAKKAWGRSSLLNTILWRLNDRMPRYLQSFSDEVFEVCNRFQPQYILCAGLMPIKVSILKAIGQMGITRINYLSDDPWNRTLTGAWILDTLAHYDMIFSTRRSNLEDLNSTGCKQVSYLPFAYTPECHYPERLETFEEKEKFESDLLFYGGADSDRARFIKACVNAGIKLHLYGHYWHRFSLGKYYQGYADPRSLRLAVGGTKINLCLIRRSNRDGHTMRTFEVPAIGGCILAEETEEHREIFGTEGEAAIYFKNTSEMLSKIEYLLKHSQVRRSMAEKAYSLIVKHKNTYRDRLETMLSQAGGLT